MRLRIYNTLYYSILKASEKNQKELFLGLSEKGLLKLTSLIKDQRELIRKLAFKIIIDLLHNNEVLQNIFCEKFNFNPIGNVICINWLPSVLREKISIDSKVIVDIKKCQNVTEKDYGTRYWKWPENSKYTDENIPDPERYLLGFFFSHKTSFVFENKGEGLSEEEKGKIIEMIEEGYEPEHISFKETNVSLMSQQNNKEKEINGNGANSITYNNNSIGNQNHNGTKQQEKKDEYKKTKAKNPSRSIDFKQMNVKYTNKK